MPQLRLCTFRGAVIGLLLALVSLLPAAAADADTAEQPDWVPFVGTHRISRAFNHPGGHLPNPGIDFAMPVGTPVRASGAGTVTYSGSMCGNTVAIHHADAGRTSRYLHLSRRDVEVGEQVRRGQVIGRSGANGCGSTGPHLHYDEVAGNSWDGGGRINPGRMQGTVDGTVRQYPDAFPGHGWADADERRVAHDGAGVEAAGSSTTQVIQCATDRSATHTFADVPSRHPFCAEVAWMAEEGITEGYSKGRFRPDAAVARDAAAPFLARAEGAAPDACATRPFRDVRRSHLFCGEIAWASGSGIATGYPDGSYRPAGRVSRAEMAAFTARQAGVELTACRTRPFRDVPTDHPVCAEIAWAAKAGVVTGHPDGTFRPARTVERDEAAAFLARRDAP